MKLKTTLIEGVSYAVLDAAGLPVYVHDDGKELGFDAASATSHIATLNRESADRRTKLTDAETQLQKFEGIDPAEARKALDTVKNLDDKKLVDAGQVETIKAEVIKAKDTEYAPIVQERDALRAELVTEKIGGAFARSTYIETKAAVPADIIESRFGDRFKIVDGKVVGHDQAGNPIYSRTNPGAVAEFEEALEIIVEAYPNKAHILKGTGNSGTGARPSDGPGAGKNPWKQGGPDYSLTEQDRIQQRDPSLAARLKAEAGVA